MDFIFRMKKKKLDDVSWKIVEIFSTNFSFKNKQNGFPKNKM